MKKLCIIVPYRDREEHLKKFIPAITEYLKNADVDFKILIVEQEKGKPFNRGKLLNVGFDYSKECDYFCFHDVDMLPEVSDYSFCDTPTHLAAAAEQFGYKLPYDKYFGGVTLFDKESFLKINGYSNQYWGWGAEDDDVFGRCVAMGIATKRKEGRYSSLDHNRDINQEDYKKNIERLRNFQSFFDGEKVTEGLTTLEYSVKSVETFPEYVKITVSI